MAIKLPQVERGTEKIDNLLPAGYNPRTITDHALEGLRHSIEAFGVVQEVIVNRLADGTLRVVGGHQRLQALKQLGIDEVAVAYVTLTDIEEKALNLTLNNSHIAGTFIKEGVEELLAQIAEEWEEAIDSFRLRELGDELDALASLDGGGGTARSRPEEESVPDPKIGTPPISQRGDLYLLGNHLLLCGDSLLEADLDRLMGDRKAVCVFTDPPWNVNYGEANPVETKDRSILNDGMSEGDWEGFLKRTAWACRRVLQPGGALYLVMADTSWPLLSSSLKAENFHMSCTIAWVKDTFVMMPSDYHNRFEPIWYGWQKGAARLFPLADRSQDNVWEFPRPKASPLHPHMKPVELVEKALLNSSGMGDVVADLFGGSGSFLIAAENTERHARVIELDGHYADVITERWWRHTGQEVYRLRGDAREPWSELRKAREGELSERRENVTAE